MEGDAAAQMEAPNARIIGILFPAFREARLDPGRLVGARQIPQHQGFENRIAKEAHALKTVIRHAGCGGHIRRGHGDAQGFRLLLRFSPSNAHGHQGSGQRRAPKAVLPVHVLSPVHGSARALPWVEA